MITKSNTITDRNLYFHQISINKYKIIQKLSGFLLITFAVIMMFYTVSKAFTGSSYCKDAFVADFRADLNKLWEVSKTIEASRARNPNILEYGTTGELSEENELNKNLKRALLNIADSNEDRKLSENEFKAMSIMKLDKSLYSDELKRLQYNNLSADNNLEHYVIVTKGKYAGTILYNGALLFADSNNRCYYGVELFEQQ